MTLSLIRIFNLVKQILNCTGKCKPMDEKLVYLKIFVVICHFERFNDDFIYKCIYTHMNIYVYI